MNDTLVPPAAENDRRICLIRHGETEFNRENRLQGVRDIDLSERGRREAVELGHMLRQAGIRPRRLFSSPLRRAYETARRLGFDCPLVPVREFRARGLGHLEGLTKSESNQRFERVIERLIEWDFYPPGGDESLRDMFGRADTHIAKLMQVDEHEVFVVTHSGVLEALARGWLRIDAPHPLPFPIKNAGAIFFRGHPGKWCYDRSLAAGEGTTTDWA